MLFRSEKQRQQVTLSVTPLIDVLFLFIIFFMLTGTFKRVGELELQLPGSATAQLPDAEDESRQLDLIAMEDGRLIVGDEPMPMSDIERALREHLTENPGSKVLIKAESGVRHGDVVTLLDIVKTAGFSRAGIGTHSSAMQDSTLR